MKLYAVHKDGKLKDDYYPLVSNDKDDAISEFLYVYDETPETLGVELVEYAPVNPATEKLVEAAKEALKTLEYVQREYSDLAPCLRCYAAICALRDALADYEATK